ncbi:M20 family metallopeptidase [Methanocaldococcus fervens]|uniref:Peptidase dimerization domain protein n=1 Tax=Methanocaldococcus fervens (strain DSM 4213 / JCM 15782 / AG86) TaxID=573064 RepID=C7P831_METFA|nr:M20 family metallopeptidase [Methanocaldococcus fervens]ACV24713.1 peptidase dimerization domain protein [Methanocaldococcus fervens AG86]
MDLDYLKILEDLVKIRTDNKLGVKKGFKYLSNLFNNLGIKNTIIEGCFVAYKEKNFDLILNSHIDTVKVQSNFNKDNNNFYGTGVIDAKGNVVLMIHAFLNSNNSLLVISPDEEKESNGIYNFCKYLKNKNIKDVKCIVGEPTDLKVCIGNKGRFEYIVESFGKAKHASTKGINPIEILSKVILDLKTLPLESIKVDKTYSSSITPTIIKGGIQSNIIPDYAYVLFDVRSVEKDIIKKIEKFLSQKDYSTHIKGSLNPGRHYADFYMLENKELINKLSKEFEISFFNATCEAFYFNKFLNADTVIYGVGKLELAHSKEEHLNLNDFDRGIKGVEKLAELITNSLGD